MGEVQKPTPKAKSSNLDSDGLTEEQRRIIEQITQERDAPVVGDNKKQEPIKPKEKGSFTDQYSQSSETRKEDKYKAQLVEHGDEMEEMDIALRLPTLEARTDLSPEEEADMKRLQAKKAERKASGKPIGLAKVVVDLSKQILTQEEIEKLLAAEAEKDKSS